MRITRTLLVPTLLFVGSTTGAVIAMQQLDAVEQERFENISSAFSPRPKAKEDLAVAPISGVAYGSERQAAARELGHVPDKTPTRVALDPATLSGK